MSSRSGKSRASRGAHGLYVHGRGDTLAILVAKDWPSGALMVDRRPQEDHGRVRLQASRSLHEGAGVRYERGDIEADNERRWWRWLMLWRRCGRAEAPRGLSRRIVRHILPRVME